MENFQEKQQKICSGPGWMVSFLSEKALTTKEIIVCLSGMIYCSRIPCTRRSDTQNWDMGRGATLKSHSLAQKLQIKCLILSMMILLLLTTSCIFTHISTLS